MHFAIFLVERVLIFGLVFYWGLKSDLLKEPLRRWSQYCDDFEPGDAPIHPSEMVLVGYPFKRHVGFRSPQISFGFTDDSLLICFEGNSSFTKQIYHLSNHKIPFSAISVEDFDHFQIIRIAGDAGIGLPRSEENVLPELRERLAWQEAGAGQLDHPAS